MAYNHTQPGRWHYVLFAFTLATLAGALVARSVSPVAVILLVAAAIDTWFRPITISSSRQVRNAAVPKATMRALAAAFILRGDRFDNAGLHVPSRNR